MSSRPIRFFHRGAVVEVDGVAPTRTVLDWLREEARCTGTKEGCNEGDCGACTVVIGTLPGEAQANSPELVGGLRLTTNNACIQFLPTLDGKALFTVEDLQDGEANGDELHPVQRAMVECDGSQCGFCTPGFVMSLWATLQHHGARGTRPTRQQLADELSGNLCRCTGTKEGCNEGDCGACTVVIGTLPGEAQAKSPELVGGLRLTTTNACIQFLPTLDGKALFTVEDLKGREANGDELHPVQRAMVECDGSQCGFCTPGFVMSLWATYQHHGARGTRPTRQQLADELSGNLCRCTGYRPILDAGERMFDLPAAPLDTAPARIALEAMRSEDTFRYATAGGELIAPKTLGAFAAERLANPEARLLAGSTDIGLWVNKIFRPLPSLLYIGDVDVLKRVEAKDGVLSIGAGASLEEAWRALVGHWSTLTDVWLRFAGVPLRHAGTMGGNVANGSPIGDSAPVLMALDASLVLRQGERIRRVALADFYTGYMQSRLEPGEFVQAIEVPLDSAHEVRAYKISKRFDCDISAVCAGLAIGLDGEVVSAVRFAFGGMAATVKRAAQAEAVVLGQPWTKATLRDAQQALAVDFAPLSDMRASAAYRLQVAQNLLRRLWLETRPTSPLGSGQTSVWSTLAHAAPLAPAGAVS